ncbi:hypothetical protein [Micromonospora globbae]|uniref:ESX-1 secretion-associated protein n=1 Tax=Micromonospora globbae TaxID=1894969 RepID=A0A420EQ99_9ACTN|nr:hypothetical protein [Micromonospora globbae]RKF22856.1 hypothetical protein D7I43_31115 [Micromonospora globbae]
MPSIHTASLRRLGEAFAEHSEQLDRDTKRVLLGLTLPSEVFPAYAATAPADYEQVRSGVEDVTVAMGKIFDTIGVALTRVAAHYEEMEEQQGSGFSYRDG